MKLKVMFALGLAPFWVHGAVITGNLLTNPGAETGTIAGWTVGGTSNPSVDNGMFDPGINPHTGNWDFFGHTGGNGTLSQTLSLTGISGITNALIDSGTLLANLSFWAQGLNQGTPSDDSSITLIFLDGSSSMLGTVTTPEIDSHNLTWQNYMNSYAVPVSTRSITYTMNFIRHVGLDNDSFVDDNSLTLGTAASSVPEPSTFGLLGGGLLAAFLFRRRFLIGRRESGNGTQRR
jgi:hypothetical protein